MQRNNFKCCHLIVKEKQKYLINNLFTFKKYPYFYISLNLNYLLMTRILSLFVMFMLFGVLAFAQNRVVTGTVTDQSGATVAGATVQSSPRNITAANPDGIFSISVPAATTTLTVSGVGFAPKTVEISSTAKTVAITVERGTNTAPNAELETVTVGALGIRTSARASGTSRTAIGQAQLLNGRPTNVAQALSGKVAGLSIVNTGAGINASPRIILRGLRSITGNNQALIVVDGVAVPSSIINTLNPNDIDRIDILKGGQSATLFGSEGVNGAIVITTKKGTSRKPEFTISNTINIESLAYLPRTQHGFGSGSTYGNSRTENFEPVENQQYGDPYDGSIRPLGRQLQDGSIQLLPYSDIADIRKKIWDKGYTRQTDVSYRAGNAGSSVFLGYQNQQTSGIVPGDKYDRNTLRFNAGNTYNKLSVNLNGTYTFDRTRQTNSDFYFFALNSASWVPFDTYKDWKNNKFADPSGYFNDYYNNPYYEKDNNRVNTRSYNFQGDLKADYKANNNLTLTGRVGFAQINTTQSSYGNVYKYSAYSKTAAFQNYHSDYYDPFLSGRGIYRASRSPFPVGNDAEAQGTSSRITFDAFLNHNKTVGKLKFTTILGSQATVLRTKSLSVSTASIAFPDLYNLGNSASGLFTGANSESQVRKIGAYIDETIGFKNFLFLHGSARQDYTSRFADEGIGYNKPQFQTYGGDISFIASDLFANAINKDSKILNMIKLTAAYNVNGNDNLGPYSLRQQFPNAGGFPYNGLLGQTVGKTLISPNLRPEKIQSAEVGAEFALFKNRLVLNASAYRAKATEQILNVTISSASGYNAYLLNAADLTNKGFEVEARAEVYRTKNLSVNLTGNYSYNTNTVNSLYGNTGLNSFTIVTVDERAAINATVGQTYPTLSTTVFQRDAQGRVIVNATDGWPEREAARKTYGTTLPKHNLGLGFNVRFKNLSFIANAEFRAGAVVYHDLGTDMAFTGSGAITAIYNRQQFIWPNSVTLDASGKSVPNTNIAVDQYKSIYSGFGDADFSRGLSGIGEVFVSSGDFWKLRDASLNYDFPVELFSKSKSIKAISLSFWGRNLFTVLAKDNWYTDPEFNFSTTSNAQGVNTTANTPPTRQLGGTIRLTF